MFCRDEQEKYGLFGTRVPGIGIDLWSSTGGLIQAKVDYLKWAKTVDMNVKVRHPDSNVREFRGGKLQRIEGCEDFVSLQGLVCTKCPKFLVHEWYDQREAKDLSKKRMKENIVGRKLWFICALDKKKAGDQEPVGYVFFFDAERYTRKQMIAVAKSIRLK